MSVVRRWLGLVFLAGVSLVGMGHVGTLDAFFAGEAGPYRLQVTVRPPGIVPGLAQVTVRVQGAGVTRVTTQAAQWNVGSRGAPAPDEAMRVAGDSTLWSSELWLMTRGSYAVNVAVFGAAGEGRVAVPVSNVATQQKAMPASLGWILAGLAAFLFLGFVSLIGASVRESVLPPGETPPPARLWRARVAMVGATVVLALVLSGGRAWWNSVDSAYARSLYRPMRMDATAASYDGRRTLRLVITDSSYLRREITPLIPDHGKLVHLFMVREPAMNALAHLHPAALDSVTLEGGVGALPGGDYRWFADVVHESGYAETITGRMAVPALASPGEQLTDRDDAVFVGDAGGEPRVTFADSSTIEMEGDSSIASGRDVLLRFTVREPSGDVATLEPYMGMPAHAMVARDDGSVFAHLHSNGSFSMAAQRVIAAIERGDTLASADGRVPRPVLRDSSASAGEHAMHVRAEGKLAFPFAFPKPGRYVAWVQFRRGDEVRTAAWRLDVR